MHESHAYKVYQVPRSEKKFGTFISLCFYQPVFFFSGTLPPWAALIGCHWLRRVHNGKDSLWSMHPFV